MVQRLLKIPTTVRTRISLEEHREPKDPDIIDLPAPVEQPVVDDGVGTGAPGAEPAPEDVTPGAAEVADPTAAPAADVPSVPAADADVSATPPAAEEPVAGEPGGADIPAEQPTDPVEPAAEPATPAEPTAADPVSEPTPPVESTPVEPAQAAEAPAADPVEGAQPDPTAPTDETTPVPGPDTGDVDPVPPAEPAADIPPVTGEAPVEPAAEPAPGDVVDSNPVPPAEAATPATEVASEPGTEPGAEPVAENAPVSEQMSSAWVDGVAVDAEEVKQHLDDAAAEVVDADNTVDELHEAAIALEELKAVISENLAEENPVVSETTVNLVNIEAEKALEKIGETHDIKSMESIFSPVDKLRVSLESISEKAKEIWEAIKKAAAKAWEAVKAFFANIFDSAQRVKNQLEKLRAGVEAVEGEPSAKTIENASLFKAIATEGDADWSDFTIKLEGITGKLSSYLQNSPRAMQSVLSNAGNALVKSIKEGNTDGAGDAFGRVALGYADLCGKFVTELTPGGATTNDRGNVVRTTGPLPGGYAIAVRSFAPNPNFADHTTVQLLVDVMTGRNVQFEQNGSVGKEVDVMTKDQMKAILDVAIKLIDAVFAGRTEIDALQSSVDQMRKDGEQAVRNADATFLENVTNRNMVVNTMNFGTNMVKFNGRVLSMATAFCSAASKGIAASIAMYPNAGAVVEGTATKVAPAGSPQLPAPAAA